MNTLAELPGLTTRLPLLMFQRQWFCGTQALSHAHPAHALMVAEASRGERLVRELPLRGYSDIQATQLLTDLIS
jgi:hypothetical protein